MLQPCRSDFCTQIRKRLRPAGELAALLRTAYLDLGASSRQSKTGKGEQGRDSGEGIIMDPPLPMVHHLLSIYISGPWAIDSAAHSRTCSEIIKFSTGFR